MTRIQIFVSYTTRDAIIDENLLAFVSELLSLYGKPFVDLLHNNSIARQAKVEQELYSADVLVLLRSISVERSGWVKWELQKAKSLGIPVIEIQIAESENRESIDQTIRENLEKQFTRSRRLG